MGHLGWDDIGVLGFQDDFFPIDDKHECPRVEKAGLFVLMAVFRDSRPWFNIEVLDAHSVAGCQLRDMATVNRFVGFFFGQRTRVHTSLTAGHLRKSRARPAGSKIHTFNTESSIRHCMFAVVGCQDCSALWIVDGQPETTTCPRCTTQHQFEKLRPLTTTEEKDAAREARSRLLAARQGEADAFSELGSFAELDTQIDDAGISDEEYLAESGLDVAEITAAGERATEGGATSRPRREVVQAVVGRLDEPTEDEIVEEASHRDVPAPAAQAALIKLVRNGDVTESDGRYRLV